VQGAGLAEFGSPGQRVPDQLVQLAPRVDEGERQGAFVRREDVLRDPQPEQL
jgi:hypothetical protein